MLAGVRLHNFRLATYVKMSNKIKESLTSTALRLISNGGIALGESEIVIIYCCRRMFGVHCPRKAQKETCDMARNIRIICTLSRFADAIIIIIIRLYAYVRIIPAPDEPFTNIFAHSELPMIILFIRWRL